MSKVKKKENNILKNDVLCDVGCYLLCLFFLFPENLCPEYSHGIRKPNLFLGVLLFFKETKRTNLSQILSLIFFECLFLISPL